MATPVFTPYLQIPVLEGFGFDVVELAAEGGAERFGEQIFDGLRDPSIKAFFIINPGNPDSRALPPARLSQLRELVTNDRPDLIIVADTVYATFVEGFRGTMTELPRNVITLHSFSKNFGATGTRVGFIAVHHDNLLDELLAQQDEATRAGQQQRYGSMTSDVTKLRFIDRLVADSREVALHNIAGLATPGQVQMALFALDYLLPRGRAYIEATRAELAGRLDALLAPMGIPAEGGQDSFYYALIDLLEVAEAQRGPDFAQQLKEKVRPEDVAMRLASEHGVVVLPGVLFGAASWEARVSLASLDADQLSDVGKAIVDVLITS
jgi:aspartate 4-decarboxylase